MRLAPWLVAALATYSLWHLYSARDIHREPGVLAAEEPQQRLLDAAPVVERGEFRLRPRAEFSATVRILHREDYSMGPLATLVPTDFAVGWGRMSDSAVLAGIEISQANRFYFWRTESWPLDRAEIESHSANWHVIPENDAVRGALGRLRAGSLVELRGRLVESRGQRPDCRLRSRALTQDPGPARYCWLRPYACWSPVEMQPPSSVARLKGLAVHDAVDADAPLLAELAARTFFEAFAADNKPDDMRAHLESSYTPALHLAEIQNPSIDTLLVRIDAGAPLAFAQLRAGHVSNGVPAEGSIELWRFYVDQLWHGQGVAHTLMAAAKARARRRGASTLWLGVWERNARAHAFYGKHGFSKVGNHVFVVGSDPQTDDVMLCEL